MKVKRGTKVQYIKKFMFGKTGEEEATVVAVRGTNMLLDNGDVLNINFSAYQIKEVK